MRSDDEQPALFYLYYAGTLRTLPTARVLKSSEESTTGKGKGKGKAGQATLSKVSEMLSLIEKAGAETEETEGTPTNQPLVPTGLHGPASLTKEDCSKNPGKLIC